MSELVREGRREGGKGGMEGGKGGRGGRRGVWRERVSE